MGMKWGKLTNSFQIRLAWGWKVFKRWSAAALLVEVTVWMDWMILLVVGPEPVWANRRGISKNPGILQLFMVMDESGTSNPGLSFSILSQHAVVPLIDLHLVPGCGHCFWSHIRRVLVLHTPVSLLCNEKACQICFTLSLVLVILSIPQREKIENGSCVLVMVPFGSRL